MTGNAYLDLEDCRVDGRFNAGFDKAGGYLRFSDSMAYIAFYSPNDRGGVVATPGWGGTVAFGATGILGKIEFNGWGRNQSQMVLGNHIPDPAMTPNSALLTVAGGTVQTVLSGIDGLGVGIPVQLNKSGSGGGVYDVAAASIRNSSQSGIQTNPLSLSTHKISVDENTPFGVVSDIENNALYGIDLSSPCTISFYDATASPTPNTAAGMRLRRGATARFAGTPGSEPTMSGPPGQEIDFDDRAPPVYILWAGAAATGLQSLTQYLK
jgi:hypothetical protein